ncbi:MAG TPA: alpha/beta fold hydrolase [Terriglobia bacterium]|nr:alpha/beta fold hydrolase [Terriglobia bacterium]
MEGRRGEDLQFPLNAFEPHPLLRSPDLMTVAGTLKWRRYPDLPPGEPRRFRVDHETEVLAICHWQPEPRIHPTIVILHGLEGSVNSSYMRGIAEKAVRSGFNAVRLNQRGCGESEHLTPTLYHSGLSQDLRSVVLELSERDALSEIIVCGYSMGGNLALKMAGEFGDRTPAALRGVVAVAPAIILNDAANAIDSPRNFLYRRHFVRELEARYRRKAQLFAQLFPERYASDRRPARTLREFDDAVTAPTFGFADADDYYRRCSAINVVSRINVPTLIIAAQDDTFIPVTTFRHPDVTSNPNIALITPAHGGHCAFISRFSGPYRFWAEAVVVDFCRRQVAGRPCPRGDVPIHS